jgi:spermidine synthase
VIRLFALTALVGAALLFVIEPMAAKALLPAVGGSPALWNVSMVAYQGLLLAGYGWAHWLGRRWAPRRQAIAQVVVVVVAVALLPWGGLSGQRAWVEWPSLWVVLTLVGRVAAPFFVLASTGPLMQTWLGVVEYPRRRDATFLYVIGNAASMGALLGYPLILERVLPLEGGRLSQTGLLCGGFLAYAALTIACAVMVVRRGQQATPVQTAARPSWWARLGWAALAFVPSGATLAVTQTITTDVAAVPLLWALPLAIYLLTFVLAFAGKGWPPQRWAAWAVAGASLAVVASQWVALRPMPRLGLPLHLAALMAVGLLCHGRLAAARPAPDALTDYYLSIALGGALGSLFCGLLAPMSFSSIAEYPIALVLACLARPDPATRRPGAPRPRRRLDALLAVGVLAVVIIVHAALGSPAGERSGSDLRIEALLCCLACALIAFRPLAFAAGVAVLFIAVGMVGPAAGQDLEIERTFFGVLRVKDVLGPSFVPRQGARAGQTVRLPMRILRHGTMLHGLQVMSPGLDHQATTYFHASGPIGHLFAALPPTPSGREVGVVGLGVGELASYAGPSSRFTFFEIDPAVVRIARDPELFSYLRDCRGRLEVVVGDGRRSLAAQPDGRFGLLVIDAFSSSSVPVHLLTREAVELYLGKLAPGGLLAMNVTGRHLDLAPVVAEVAASLGRPGLHWNDEIVTPTQFVAGKQPSHWVVVAATAAALDPLRAQQGWQPLESQRRPGTRPWTDRQSSPLSALR